MHSRTNKLLAIVGPTATGKTARAIEEFHKTPSILISADSRQVYRGMNIVTGKDHPKDILIYGIDLVSPDQSCSVSLWYDAVIPHLTRAWEEGKQVIVVGGTGLYLSALTDGIPTMAIPPNPALRSELAKLSLAELQVMLQALSSAKFSSMNHSDRSNPRRLTRAIEILKSGIYPNKTTLRAEVALIGLRLSSEEAYATKITSRVMSRLKVGAISETEKLLTEYDSKLPSMTAIGYRSIIKYLQGEYSEQLMINTWVKDELAYVKRQLTWFNKLPNVKWYDNTK